MDGNKARSGHQKTMATQYLFRSEAPHVSALEEMFQVVTEVGDVGVHRDLRGEGGGKEGGGKESGTKRGQREERKKRKVRGER